MVFQVTVIEIDLRESLSQRFLLGFHMKISQSRSQILEYLDQVVILPMFSLKFFDSN